MNTGTVRQESKAWVSSLRKQEKLGLRSETGYLEGRASLGRKDKKEKEKIMR